MEFFTNGIGVTGISANGLDRLHQEQLQSSPEILDCER